MYEYVPYEARIKRFARTMHGELVSGVAGYERNDSGIGLDVICKGLSPNGAEEGVNIGVLAEGLDSIKGGWPVSKCAS